DGKLAFRPFRYTDLIVPSTQPHLRAQDRDNRVQLVLPKVVLQQTPEGKYDLELLVMMDRTRGDPECRLARPDFFEIEVRPGANQPPLRAIVAVVNYYPAPAWSVRVPNWPHKTNPLIAAVPPSISTRWVVRLPVASKTSAHHPTHF